MVLKENNGCVMAVSAFQRQFRVQNLCHFGKWCSSIVCCPGWGASLRAWQLALPLGLTWGCSAGWSLVGPRMRELRRYEMGVGKSCLRGWTSKGGISMEVQD